MDDLDRQVAALFGLAPASRSGDGANGTTAAEWMPLVDIAEDDQAYTIKAELPEVRRDDVSVTLENGVLTLSGERKPANRENTRHYHRVERAYGRFARSFTLPDDARGQEVSAEFKDGVLTVSVPKDEKAQPRAIEIKAG